jgi:hypothetical protein
MSSAELIAEILALSNSLAPFNQFQILSLSQSNNLFAFAPELITFSQSCGNELQQLLELSQSSLFNSLIETNINLAGSLSPCLGQLLGLEQLLTSGQNSLNLSNNGNNNVNNNLNGTDVSNSTAGVSASNSTAVANSTADASSQQQNSKEQNAKGKGKKNGKRGEVVSRSGASKKQALGGLGLGLMVIVGAFAL